MFLGNIRNGPGMGAAHLESQPSGVWEYYLRGGDSVGSTTRSCVKTKRNGRREEQRKNRGETGRRNKY